MRKQFAAVVLVVLAFCIQAEEKKTLYILPFIAGKGVSPEEVQKIRNGFIEELKKTDLFKIKVSEDILKELNLTEYHGLEVGDIPEEKLRNKIINRMKTDYFAAGTIEKDKPINRFHIILFDSYSGKVAMDSYYHQDFLKFAVEEIRAQKARIFSHRPSEYFFFSREEYDRLPGDRDNVQTLHMIIEKKDTPNTNDKLAKAPLSPFKDILTGKDYSLGDFKGKLVVFGIFDKSADLDWELELLERIGKLYPENVQVIFGVNRPDKSWLEQHKILKKMHYPVIDAVDIYGKWPKPYQAFSDSNCVNYTYFNTNFIITEEGFIAGVFDKGFLDWNRFRDFSTSQKIEELLSAYFKDNLKVKKAKLSYTLAEAAERDDLVLVRALLSQGADPEIPEGKNTALTFAAKNNNREMVKLLLDSHADPLAGYTLDQSSLYFALFNGSLEIADLLVTRAVEKGRGTSRFNQYMSDGLDGVSETDNIGLLKYLLGKIADYGIEISPVMYSLAFLKSIGNGNMDMFKLLVQTGADPKDELFYTVQDDSRLEFTKYLVSGGADLFSTCFNANKMNPYQLAQDRRQPRTLAYLDSVLKGEEAKYGKLLAFAREALDYKEILARGFKPKLSPDFQFPCTQQGPNECWGYAVKHIVQYKYGETLDVHKFSLDYGKDWISYNQGKFLGLNGLSLLDCSNTNRFYYLLVTGEPVILNYKFTNKDKSVVWHYGVAYSFDSQGVWISDSVGAQRWRMPYDRLFADGSDVEFVGSIVK